MFGVMDGWMGLYDRLFNVARRLERRAIECESQIEAECLIEIMIAVEDASGETRDTYPGQWRSR